MTLEERLKQVLGEQAFVIAMLQSEVEKYREQLARLTEKKPEVPNG